MAKKSISKNYLYNLFYQILLIIMPLITTPYLSRVLGAEAIGIYSYTMSITTYFILFGTLGIAMYGQREVAYVQDNKEERSRIFWEICLLRFITMSISMIIFIFTYARNGEYSVYYRILIIELISQCLDISWFFQGMEEFKKTVTRNSIVKLIFAVSIFIFIKSQSDLLKYILIIICSNLLGNITLWMYLPKYINRVKNKKLKIFRHFKPTIMLFIPQIAMQIYTVLDKTMLGWLIEDKSEVGYYEQAQKVVKLLLTVVTSLGAVMVPRMASTYAKGDNEQLKRYMYNSFQFVFSLAFPIMAGIYLVSDEFVPIFFGQGYEKVSILIKVILPIILFIGVSSIIGTQFLLPTKRQKEFTISVVGGAIVNFILNFITIKKLNSIGASISTAIAEFMVSAIQIYYIKDIIEIRKVLKLSVNNVIGAAIMIVIISIMSKFIQLNGIYMLILKIIVGILIYGIILIALKDEFIIKIFNMTKEKFQMLKAKLRRT